MLYYIYIVFTLQEKIIRNVVDAKTRTSCKSLFRKLEILPVSCQYVFLLMNLIVNNQEIFQTDSSIHSINTRNKHHLHRSNANLSCFQKSAFYTGIKIFNSLLLSPTSLWNEKAQFKVALRGYLHTLFTFFLNFAA
jgi:IS1 family transposase